MRLRGPIPRRRAVVMPCFWKREPSSPTGAAWRDESADFRATEIRRRRWPELETGFWRRGRTPAWGIAAGCEWILSMRESGTLLVETRRLPGCETGVFPGRARYIWWWSPDARGCSCSFCLWWCATNSISLPRRLFTCPDVFRFRAWSSPYPWCCDARPIRWFGSECPRPLRRTTFLLWVFPAAFPGFGCGFSWSSSAQGRRWAVRRWEARACSEAGVCLIVTGGVLPSRRILFRRESGLSGARGWWR